MGSGLWAKSTEVGDVCRMFYAVLMSRFLGEEVQPVAKAPCKQAGDGKRKKDPTMDVGSRDSASTFSTGRINVRVEVEDWSKVP